MDGSSSAAFDVIEAAKRREQETLKARREDEKKRAAHHKLWVDAQDVVARAIGTRKIGHEPFVALAKAIAARHRDGDKALLRFQEELTTDIPWVASGRADSTIEEHAAKMAIVDALLEASNAKPNAKRIAEFVRKARATVPSWPTYDLWEVKQGLESLRKVDILAEQKRRRDAAELAAASAPPPVEEPVPQNGKPESAGQSFASPSDLQKLFPALSDKSRKWYLDFRKSHPRDFEEIADAAGNQPRYLYRVAAIEAELGNANGTQKKS